MGGSSGKTGPGVDLSDPFRLVKGDWGDPKTIPQKGIVTYGVAPNRQNPLAGIWRAAVFNTFRRTRGHILYWAVPMLIGYSVMQWATGRNEYLNSKAGRAEFGEE